MQLNVIIMAGGLGKRMKSEIPKVLHKLSGKPMLVHVLETANKLHVNKIYIVVGKFKEIIKTTLCQYIDIHNIIFVDQPEALGTGHAIQCVRPYLLEHNVNEKVVILSGDVPLLKTNTINSLNTQHSVSLLATEYENPTGYGRIIQDINNNFVKIVEQKDCDEKEKAVKIINAGVYMFNISLLTKYLPMISNNNAQNEFYLTDIFEIIKTHENISIGVVNLPKQRGIELVGINTKEQLEELESKLK